MSQNSESLRFMAIIFLMAIIVMKYLDLEVSRIFIYALLFFGVIYLLTLFKSWWKYK